MADTIEYGASSIVTDFGLRIVRRRPTQYLPDLEHAGITHAIVEIQDNSFDEVTIKGGGGEVNVLLFPDPDRNTFQVVIRDNGRGIPFEKLVDSYTKPHSSGKYDTSVYTYSSGLFGVGAKVAAGLSEKFRAISHRPNEGSMSIFIQKGEHAETGIYETTPVPGSGMSVAFELDSDIFTYVDTYAEGGWGPLLERIKKYSYFHNAHILFHVADKPLPEEVWSEDNSKAISLLDNIISETNAVFDSAEFDREKWLRGYLSISDEVSWSHSLSRVADKESSLSFKAELYYSAGSPGSSRFGMVNSVPIDVPSANHLSVIVVALKEKLVSFIAHKDVKTFFLDIYKLPVYLAVDVKYEGAEFSGTTKHNFINASFRAEYRECLQALLNAQAGNDACAKLYELISDDIQDKYLASKSGWTTNKVGGRLYEDLNHPNKFANCTTTDRTQAELFIVEGDSGGSGIKSMRDGETMAIYSIRGKPFNPAKNHSDLDSVSLVARGDGIYQDIIRLIGLKPGLDSLDQLNFGRVILLTDADPDGKHIASILIASIYAISPEFVTSGRLQVVTPPYYGITYTGRKGAKKKQYVINYESLISWMSDHVYEPSVAIEVSYSIGSSPWAKQGEEFTKKLTGANYRDFVRGIMQIGDLLSNMATELVIEPLILEQIALVTRYLNPDYISEQVIQEAISADRVNYDERSQVLTMSIGLQDHVIPLHNIKERIYRELLPMLQKLSWRRLKIYITYKNQKDAGVQEVTVGQLYAVLKGFDSLFHIDQFKGVGGMEPEDCYRTCMDPVHRTAISITGISDVDKAFRLLGRDSGPRKKLLERNLDQLCEF